MSIYHRTLFQQSWRTLRRVFARRDPQPFRPSSPYPMREEYPTREIDTWLRGGEVRE